MRKMADDKTIRHTTVLVYDEEVCHGVCSARKSSAFQAWHELELPASLHQLLEFVGSPVEPLSAREDEPQLLGELLELAGRVPARRDHDLRVLHTSPTILVILGIDSEVSWNSKDQYKPTWLLARVPPPAPPWAMTLSGPASSHCPAFANASASLFTSVSKSLQENFFKRSVGMKKEPYLLLARAFLTRSFLSWIARCFASTSFLMRTVPSDMEILNRFRTCTNIPSFRELSYATYL